MIRNPHFLGHGLKFLKKNKKLVFFQGLGPVSYFFLAYGFGDGYEAVVVVVAVAVVVVEVVVVAVVLVMVGIVVVVVVVVVVISRHVCRLILLASRGKPGVSYFILHALPVKPHFEDRASNNKIPNHTVNWLFDFDRCGNF